MLTSGSQVVDANAKLPDESLTTPHGPEESAVPSPTKMRALHISEVLWKTI